MTLALQWRRLLVAPPLLGVLVLALPTLDASVGRQGDELYAHYAKPPKALPAPESGKGLLLVDIVMRFPLGAAQLEGAAVVATDSSAVITRAKSLSRFVVLFHLPAGVHALRFVTAQTAHAALAVAVPPGPEFTVAVPSAGISYLGTTTVQKKMGFAPPAVQILYDAQRERDSWTAFLKKYPNSPWAELARARLDSLRGGQP